MGITHYSYKAAEEVRKSITILPAIHVHVHVYHCKVSLCLTFTYTFALFVIFSERYSIHITRAVFHEKNCLGLSALQNTKVSVLAWGLYIGI